MHSLLPNYFHVLFSVVKARQYNRVTVFSKQVRFRL